MNNISKDDSPFLSVCMITYNHESFITRAIEGVLMQKTNFPIELIIGEDCSSDRTSQICKAYKKSYPDIIKLRLEKKNIGMMQNFIATLRSSTGKYIALCEGDDYWTDPYKLEKQVDFLEKNKDFSICFHKVSFKYEDSPNKIFVTNTNMKKVSTIDDLANDNFICTLSCVFRNNFKNSFPDFIRSCPIGDYPLNLWNAQFGKIFYLDENMAIYRVHKNGIWEVKSEMEKIKTLIYTLDQLIGNFDEKINTRISHQQVRYLMQLYELQKENSNFESKYFLIPKGLKYVLSEYRGTILNQEEEIKKIGNSYSHKIGSFIIKPFRYFKRRLKWLKLA